MTAQLFSVQNQVVIISGGSRGIGRALARGFAEREAEVIITGRDAETLAQAADEISTGTSTVMPIVCDVAKTDDIHRLVGQVLSDFGQVDTLINVAGVNRRKSALELTEDDYDFIMDINLKGAFLMSQAVGRQMVEHGSGCQINIASLNTDRPLKHVLPYAMSKAAIAHMTRGLALEWGPRGVRVNGIAPGFILTDLTQKLWSDKDVHAWGMANTPQRRLGVPDDLVGAAIFLASPAAEFMTGQTIYVDGGFTAGSAWPIPDGGGQ
jgi:NAD(P)-dependent dehydrogenase (short-subunit alcohol dehydrogenase family)